MSGSLRLAREAMTATLTALALPGVTVLGFEPPMIANGTTVTVSSAGVSPTDWTIAVRVYVVGTQPDDAQNTLDDTVVLIDAGLTSAPRSTWVFEYSDNRQAFVATVACLVGREDF